MIIPSAKTTTANYVSYFCSRYYPWFVELGYPRLDLLEEQDGSWAIIQMDSSPVVPSLTSWRRVLQGIENVEISWAFIKKYIEEIDIQRRAFWDREWAKTKAVEDEFEAVEQHREDFSERAFKAIRQNPTLMERISRNGLKEMNLDRIYKNIPRYRL